jgi:hypothetical protein
MRAGGKTVGQTKRAAGFSVVRLAIAALFVAGCVNRGVGIAYRDPIDVICIENNPAVTAPDFEHDLEHQLFLRGINAKVIAQYSKCPELLTLRYSARRSGFERMVTLVTLDVYKNEEKVAFIDWNSRRGFGGLPKVPWELMKSVKYPQLAEALAALFGEIEIKPVTTN